VTHISILKNSAKALTRSRLGYALFSGAKSLTFSFARTFYSLWLEIVGLLAAGFTIRTAAELLRIYRGSGLSGDPKHFWVALAVMLFCLWFSVASFLKARRIRKQTHNPAVSGKSST
jgi:divalent metal cation (Fe/Co/Zn/Cd) transporter